MEKYLSLDRASLCILPFLFSLIPHYFIFPHASPLYKMIVTLSEDFQSQRMRSLFEQTQASLKMDK